MSNEEREADPWTLSTSEAGIASNAERQKNLDGIVFVWFTSQKSLSVKVFQMGEEQG